MNPCDEKYGGHGWTEPRFVVIPMAIAPFRKPVSTWPPDPVQNHIAPAVGARVCFRCLLTQLVEHGTGEIIKEYPHS